jgi:uncharacterized protein with GYD domain
MPRYLIRVSYTPEAWATLVKNPQNRREAIRPVIDALGGKLEAFYFAFGEEDAFIIADMPDNVSAAAFAMAATAGGAVNSYTTTVLMSVEEAMEAMRKAIDRPPNL